MALQVRAQDQELVVSHGYSFYGDLTYPADYTHFNYVNPDAPKGGEISMAFVGTLDSLNPYNGKGRAHLFSIFQYESLLGEAPSNVSVPADVYGEAYCLLCERLEYPANKEWVTFYMRPEARFSDGTPVTAHDVEFSFNLILAQGLPSYAQAVSARVPKFEVIDDHTIKFYFQEGIPRRSLIETVGGVPVWSKKWFEETGIQMSDTWTEPPIGSGAYQITDLDLTRRMVLERRDDYWGKDLAFNVGRNNFDRIRLEIFSDDTASFEGFKAGEYTMRTEGDSRKWAVSYDFPKAREGAVVKKELRDGQPPTSSGIIFNLGREPLKDKRVREALALAYNFEWTNESLQYGLFKQRESFSQNSPVMAVGVAEGAELELLKSLGDLVPADMLAGEARAAHTSNPARVFDRRNARQASKLLDEAGYAVGADGIRTTPDGKPFELSFLFNSASSATGKAVMENFTANVRKLGVDIKLDAVDTAQYTARERERDYDLVFDTYSTFLGAGTGLLQLFGSETAEFSLFNPAGYSSPLVDEILDRALKASELEDEQAALKALDRALRYEFFVIPLWFKPNHWVAFYDQYEHPDVIPPFALGQLDFWWYNAEKAQALKASGALR
ncbi:MAG: extracellular solute-binding protein [Aliishimia sp.]